MWMSAVFSVWFFFLQYVHKVSNQHMGSIQMFFFEILFLMAVKYCGFNVTESIWENPSVRVSNKEQSS